MVKAVLLIATAVLAWADVSDVIVAVTVIDFSLALAGAVNRPLAEMLPELADQVTAVILVSLTDAEN
jgi:hypothetical protein